MVSRRALAEPSLSRSPAIVAEPTQANHIHRKSGLQRATHQSNELPWNRFRQGKHRAAREHSQADPPADALRLRLPKTRNARHVPPAAVGAAVPEETMTAMRRRRLERLEHRQPRGPVWRDPFPVAMAIWMAMEAEHDAERAGRRFSRLPADPPTPEAE